MSSLKCDFCSCIGEELRVFSSCSSCFNLKSSSLSLRISALRTSAFIDSDSSLMWALSFTILALCANFNVESDSWKELGMLDIVAMIKVLLLPLRESLNTNVSFESRNGTCSRFYPLRLLMTIPRVVSDLLMLLASFKRSPMHAVDFCRSEPAKSTKCSLLLLRLAQPLTTCLLWMFSEKTA